MHRSADIMDASMQVVKWGDSLAVQLPRKIVEEPGLKPGDEVDIVGADSGLMRLAKRDRRAEIMLKMEAFKLPLPADYRFEREEANAR